MDVVSAFLNRELRDVVFVEGQEGVTGVGRMYKRFYRREALYLNDKIQKLISKTFGLHR